MEEAWVNVYRNRNGKIVVGDVHDSEEEAKRMKAFPGRMYIKTKKII